MQGWGFDVFFDFRAQDSLAPFDCQILQYFNPHPAFRELLKLEVFGAVAA